MYLCTCFFFSFFLFLFLYYFKIFLSYKILCLSLLLLWNETHTAWTAWSTGNCNVTCGIGTRKNVRDCVGYSTPGYPLVYASDARLETCVSAVVCSGEAGDYVG